MQIDSNLSTNSQYFKENAAANGAKQAANLASKFENEDGSKITAKELSTAYFMEFSASSFNISQNGVNAQKELMDILSGASEQGRSFISAMASSIGYEGKDIASMNQTELKDLVGENGFFGVTNTANRIADFIISGAGDNAEKLQQGFDGMKRGFEEAARLWGGNLPDISNQTIDLATRKVAERLGELGSAAIDLNA